jgi:hypothetical protein
MPLFILQHRHAADECGPSFAAWQGFDSPLRRTHVPSTCLDGGHHLWWTVEASDVRRALALLPGFVADRTTPILVRRVEIP